MGRQVAAAVYIIVMVLIIVGVDILFLRHNFWPRLMSNIGIVLIFGAFYLRYLKHP